MQNKGLVVKSIGCSSTGPEFESQHVHGGSQPSIMGSAYPSGVHKNSTPIYIKYISESEKKKKKKKNKNF